MINITKEKVSLTCPETTTWNEWSIIAGCANKTGYAIGEVDDAKRVYSRLVERGEGEYVFNKDIADEIREMINGTASRKFSKELCEECVDAVTEVFGKTEQTKLAGYLTINGDFLRFSYDGWMRDIDHREVSEILVDKGVIPEIHEYSEPLIAFMDMGNIRIQDFGIDISVMPNKKQWEKLDKVFNRITAERGEVIVDLSAKETGVTISSLVYDRGETFLIESEVKEFFETGLLPKRAKKAA